MTATRVALTIACVSAILPAAASTQTLDPAPPAVPPRPALERELSEILAEPAYRQAMRAGDQDARGAARWLRQQLRRLFDRLGGMHETNYGLFLVSVILGGALLLALLTHIGYTLARALRRASRPVSARERDAPRRPQTPDELRRQAEALAQQGRCREAVRALYLALIRRLQVGGLLPRTAAYTNSELLAFLRDRDGLLAAVRPFTEVFDSRWYGGRLATPEDVARCREWYEAARLEVEAP